MCIKFVTNVFNKYNNVFLCCSIFAIYKVLFNVNKDVGGNYVLTITYLWKCQNNETRFSETAEPALSGCWGVRWTGQGNSPLGWTTTSWQKAVSWRAACTLLDHATSTWFPPCRWVNGGLERSRVSEEPSHLDNRSQCGHLVDLKQDSGQIEGSRR